MATPDSLVLPQPLWYSHWNRFGLRESAADQREAPVADAKAAPPKAYSAYEEEAHEKEPEQIQFRTNYLFPSSPSTLLTWAGVAAAAAEEAGAAVILFLFGEKMLMARNNTEGFPPAAGVALV